MTRLSIPITVMKLALDMDEDEAVGTTCDCSFSKCIKFQKGENGDSDQLMFSPSCDGTNFPIVFKNQKDPDQGKPDPTKGLINAYDVVASDSVRGTVSVLVGSGITGDKYMWTGSDGVIKAHNITADSLTLHGQGGIDQPPCMINLPNVTNQDACIFGNNIVKFDKKGKFDDDDNWGSWRDMTSH